MALRCAYGFLSGRWIQREPELTDIEVTAGVGKRLLEYMELALLLLGGGLWTSFLDQRDCFF